MLHNIQFAWKMIQKRPLRMGLTLLQIALGVAAVTLVLCFVFSLLYPEGASLQQDLMRVEYGKEEKMEYGIAYSAEPAFSTKVVDNVRKRATYIDGLTVLGHEYGSYIDCEGIRYRSGIMYGVDANFEKMIKLEMADGTFFTVADVQSRTPVVVISEDANRQMFGEKSGLGKTLIKSNGNGLTQELKIIGIYKIQNQLRQNGLIDVHFIVPYSTLSSYTQLENGGQEPSYEWLLASCKPGKHAEAKEELSQLFEQELRSSGWKPQQEGLGLIIRGSNEDEKRMRAEMVKTFGLFLGSFAFVALVVSSIGILSMMLVSVVERTREIGLRRSLGASRRSILGQILSESVFLAVCGGVGGWVLAFIGMEPIMNGLFMRGFLSNFMGIAIHMDLRALLVALGTTILVGLLAGLYPGMQASRLSPVEAIREG